MVKSRREQQTDETRAALLKAGRSMFGRKGFAETPAEGIVSCARVTRGALYHHFEGGKLGLFEAVARMLQAELVEAMQAEANKQKQPWAKVRALIQAYFDFADDPTYQQVTLYDGPAVLGAEKWRDIEYEYTLRLIESGLQALIERGEIGAVSTPMLAPMIFGACCSATLTVAGADSPETAKAEAVETVYGLVRGLRKK